MLFKLCFQILAEFLSKNNLLDKDDLLENDNGWVQNDFLRVCGMCVSHNWYNLCGYCILYGTWILDGGVDYIICTAN